MAKAEREFQDWELRQIKTFSKWCNMYLSKKGHGSDMIKDGPEFAGSWWEGVAIMKLMNALYDVDMPKKYKKQEFFEKYADDHSAGRIFAQNNVALAMRMIDKAEVKTTNLKAIMIMDGDFRTLAGMVWNVILDYNLKGVTDVDVTAKQGLLIWCQKKTKGYKGIDDDAPHNFWKDWSNGNCFLALVDRHTTALCDYDEMHDASPADKLEKAFAVCEELGIMRLLEGEDVINAQKQDEQSIMTYVSELFKLFSKEDIKENAANHIANFLKFQRRVDQLQTDYEDRYRELEAWINAKIEHYSSIETIESQSACAELTQEYKAYLCDEKCNKMVDVIDIQELYSSLQGELKSNGRPAYTPPEGLEVENLNEMTNALQATENQMMAKVNKARVEFVDSIKVDEGLSNERLEEFDHSFDVFDADKSGHLNKDEFKAALSAVGVSLNEGDLDHTFDQLANEEHFVEREVYLNYLKEFFSNSDDADSIMKSLQVLGDPTNVTAEDLLYNPLTEEDVAYLMSKAEEGSLEAFINQSFA